MTGPWRSRGYLPHFDQPGLIQMITFHLADSLPAEALERMVDDPRLRNSADRRRQLNQWLLAGHGTCHLRNPQIAITVERALQHFNGTRSSLVAWVVMPNHVHVLIETFADHTLADVVNG